MGEFSERGGDGERRKAYHRGLRAETIAACFLLLKGYRVLARRYKTPVGEIDLVVRRGRRIAFVEVKRRVTVQLCEASVTGQTRRRVRQAAHWWISRHERYQDFDQGFDIVFLAGYNLPRHLKNAL